MAREYIPKTKYIRPEVWKRITSIIRDYNELKKEYDKLQDQGQSMARLPELERKIKAFEDVFYSSSDETQKLIRLKFWERRPYRDIMMPLSERTMQRIVSSFIRRLGSRLGETD